MIRDFLRKCLTYSVGNLLQSALSLVLLPLYLHFFAPEEYGVISVLAVVMSLLSLFLSGGVLNGLIRLYYEASENSRRGLMGSTWLWHLLLGALGAFTLWHWSDWVSTRLFHTGAYAHLLPIAGVVLFSSMLRAIPFSILRIEKRASLYVGYSLLNFLSDFGMKLYLIVHLERGVRGYLESSALANMLVLIFMLPSVWRSVVFRVDVNVLRQLLRLGFPYVFSGLAVWVLDVSDRLLLSLFVGEAEVGLYSVAYTFANVFLVLVANPVFFTLDPFLFDFAAEHSGEETKQLLRRSLRYFVLAGGIVYLAIALGSGEALRVLTLYFGAQEKYSEAVKLVPILAVAPFLYFLSYQSGVATLLAKRPERNSIACVAAAVFNFGLNLYAIPRFGAVGAAGSTLFAYILLLVLAYWQAERVFPVGYDWKGVSYVLACTAVTAVLWGMISTENPVVSVVVRLAGGISCFLVLVIASGSGLSVSERSSVRDYLLNSGARRILPIRYR